MKRFTVTLTGKTPLLMHSDNIEWSDEMARWKDDPKNKAESKAGDDRTPAFRWLGCCYHDGTRLVVPSDNLMRTMMEGGAMVPVPGGRGGKTFKAQTQSGILVEGNAWPLTLQGAEVSWPALAALRDELDFNAHVETVRKLGFDLLVKRAKVGTSKHIRVRPMFDRWAASGNLLVVDAALSLDVMRMILEAAGTYKGLGDWRPGGKTPGAFGSFTAVVKEVRL